jgi:hypothetical protein
MDRRNLCLGNSGVVLCAFDSTEKAEDYIKTALGRRVLYKAEENPGSIDFSYDKNTPVLMTAIGLLVQ